MRLRSVQKHRWGSNGGTGEDRGANVYRRKNTAGIKHEDIPPAKKMQPNRSRWEQLMTGINNINKTATMGCHKEHDCRY